MDQYLRRIFAANVREIRTSMCISQEELAEKCGLHRTYISDIERGRRNISIDNIERIAIGLQVLPEKLLESRQAKMLGRLTTAT